MRRFLPLSKELAESASPALRHARRQPRAMRSMSSWQRGPGEESESPIPGGSSLNTRRRGLPSLRLGSMSPTPSPSSLLPGNTGGPGAFAGVEATPLVVEGLAADNDDGSPAHDPALRLGSVRGEVGYRGEQNSASLEIDAAALEINKHNDEDDASGLAASLPFGGKALTGSFKAGLARRGLEDGDADLSLTLGTELSAIPLGDGDAFLELAASVRDSRTGEGWQIGGETDESLGVLERLLPRSTGTYPRYEREVSEAREQLLRNRDQSAGVIGDAIPRHMRLPGGDDGLEPETIEDILDGVFNRGPALDASRDARNEREGTRFRDRLPADVLSDE